jgi:integrase
LIEDNIRKGFFERDQFEAVRRHLPEELHGIVTFAYVTGWRMGSEILPLEWKQIDRKARMIRLEPGTTKNREGRMFPYGDMPELVEVIDQAWRSHEQLRVKGTISPYVFHRPRPVKQPDGTWKLTPGQPIKSIRKVWESACTAAGVHRLKHDFRRTAVRNLERAGVSRSAAMKLVGHQTESIYRRYAIVDEDTLKDAVAKLARAGQGRFGGAEHLATGSTAFANSDKSFAWSAGGGD